MNLTNITKLKDMDSIDTDQLNGGTQKITFDSYNNKIHFKNLQYNKDYYLNTRTGENNFTMPSIIDDITINKLTLTQQLRVFPETQLLIGPSNLQATYTISGLVDQINTNRITNDIQAQQIQVINTKNQEQDDQIRVIKQKNLEQDGRLDAVEQKNIEQDNRLNDIDEEIEEIEEKDREQDNQITEIQEEIEEIEEKDQEQDNRITTLETNQANDEQNIANLIQQVNEMNEEYEELEEEMHEADTLLYGQIHLLQSAVDQDRVQNNLAHQNLQHQINQINNAGFERRISALEFAVQAIQGQISNINQTISGMQDDIGDLDDALDQEIDDRKHADNELSDKIDEASGWEKFEDVIKFMEELEKILAEIIEIIKIFKLRMTLTQAEQAELDARIALITQYLTTLAQKRQSLASKAPQNNLVNQEEVQEEE